MQEYIKKKILRSGHCPLSSVLHNNNTILITSNDEMKDFIKIVKSFKDSSLLPKRLKKTILHKKIKLKKKEEDFLVCYKVN